MGFSLGGAVNGAAEWACSSPLVGGVVSNGVFAALLVTALIVLALMGIYREEARAGGRKKGVRAVLAVLLIASGVMFVHHYAVSRAFAARADREGLRDAFEGIQAARALGGGAPVVPDISAEYRRGDGSELAADELGLGPLGLEGLGLGGAEPAPGDRNEEAPSFGRSLGRGPEGPLGGGRRGEGWGAAPFPEGGRGERGERWGPPAPPGDGRWGPAAPPGGGRGERWGPPAPPPEGRGGGGGGGGGAPFRPDPRADRAPPPWGDAPPGRRDNIGREW